MNASLKRVLSQRVVLSPLPCKTLIQQTIVFPSHLYRPVFCIQVTAFRRCCNIIIFQNCKNPFPQSSKLSTVHRELPQFKNQVKSFIVHTLLLTIYHFQTINVNVNRFKSHIVTSCIFKCLF